MTTVTTNTCPFVRRSHAARHGVASVLAMLFMVLFAILALGFVAMVGTSTQVAHNDADSARSMLAAESSMQFARYHLANVDIGNVTGSDAVFDKLYEQLSDRLNGTANLGGHAISMTGVSGSRVIHIPGLSNASTYNWIDFGPEIGAGRIVIRQAGAALEVMAAGQLGEHRPARKAIQYDFDPVRLAWVSPGQGVLTRSVVNLTNGAKVVGGDVTSASTSGGTAVLTMNGGARISANASGTGGNFYYVSGAGSPSITNGAKVDGTIQVLPEAPVFPTVDTSIFEQFVPSATAQPQVGKVITKDNIYSIPATAKMTNIRIKANPTGSTLYFGNSMEFHGVIYIESPNKVNFGGGSRICGIIVTDNNLSVPSNQCEITLANGVRMEGVENLDPSEHTAGEWNSERLAQLKALSGTLILAPNYGLILAGGSRTYAGQLVADRFHLSNGYKGTIAGNLIGLGSGAPFHMEGGTQVTFTSGSSTGAGLYRGSSFAIDPSSYMEVDPGN